MEILERGEIAEVVSDLRWRGHEREPHKRSKNARQNLAVFRLSCCYGLRRQEISRLRLGDLNWAEGHATLRVTRWAAKGSKSRVVRLDWSPGAKVDLWRWCQERVSRGANASDLVICDLRPEYYGLGLDPTSIAKRWRTAIRILGPQRVEQLSVHQGRHTFVSHALASGRALPVVRDAAGHSSIAITDVYLHAIDDPELPPVFAV